jgi:predicted ester cyclase
MHTKFLPTLGIALSLSLAAGCPANEGDSKDAKKDGKSKVAAKDGKDAKKPDAKKPDAKKPDAKKPDEAKVDEPPKAPATGEEIAKWFQGCWASFGTDWDAFGKCYATDAVSIDSMGTHTGRDAIVEMAKQFTAAFSEPQGGLQLTLVNGNNVVAIARVGGKHTGPMKMPGAPEIPATNKSYSILTGHVVTLDDTGHEVTKEWFFADSGSMMGQLGLHKEPHRKAIEKDWDTKPVVIAKNDEAEKKNVEAHAAFVTAFNAKDIKGIGDMMADDAVWSEAASPADMNKKEFLKDLPAMFKGFSDLKITNDTSWGAGDYVVSTGTWAGTNDGDIKQMKLKKTGKAVSLPFVEITEMKDGKIAKNWIFYDGMQFAVQLGLIPAPGGETPTGDKPADEKKPDEAKADEKKADEKKADEKKADEKGG